MKICKLVRGALAVAALTMSVAQSVFAADITVQVATGQEAFGKVSGGKVNAKDGSALTLKATATKGYGFCGWYDGSTLVSYRSSWKYVVEGSDKTFTAKFVAAQDDGLDLTDKKPSGYTLDIGETPVASSCYSITRRPEATALSETTIKVSGLPSGVKAVTGIDQNRIGYVEFTGAPTKEGVYYVTFEAKNANGYEQSVTQKWIVGGADPANGDFDDAGFFSSDDLFGKMYVGKGVDYDSGSLSDYTKATMTGLPSGMKFCTRVETIGNESYLYCWTEGYPSKSGKHVLNYAITVVGGIVFKARKTVIVKDAGSYYVAVDVGDGCADYGTVKGSGVYRVGAKVALSATPVSKDYVFAGWFTDKACTKPLVSDDNVTASGDYFTASGDHRKASDSMTFYYEAIHKARKIYAKFLHKGSDSILLRTDLASKDWWETGDVNPYVKDYIGYAVDSGTLPTVTAKGLPPGFKLDTKNSRIEVDHSKVKPGAVYENVQLIAKNLTGLTDVKTFTVYIGNYTSYLMLNLRSETDAYEAMVGENMEEWLSGCNDLQLSDPYGDWKTSASGLPSGVKFGYDGKYFWLTGVPSKAGVYTPIFTFTRGSGTYKETQKFSFTITVYEQSPALIGTFNGVTCWDDTTYTDIRPQSRPVAITSAKGGKVTAKIGNISFSGNGWVHDGGSAWSITLSSAKVKETDGTFIYNMLVNGSSEYGDLGANDLTGGLWRTSEEYGYEELADGHFFAKQNCYGKKYWTDDRAAELAAMKAMYFGDVKLSAGWVSLTRTDNTKAPIKVTVDKKGVMKLSGKVEDISVSGTTTLLPEIDGSLTGWLPISVKTKDGCFYYHLFHFTYKDNIPSLELKVYYPCSGY